MRVSILIPAYNAEDFVGAAIDSVLQQTYADWEIVAVDDASSDATLAALRRFASDGIHVHANEQNLGMTGNWNRCLSFARGELVLKLDADDALKPRALELLVAAFEGETFAAGIRTLTCDIDLEPFDGIAGDDIMLRNGIDPYRDTVRDDWYDFAAIGSQLWASSAFMVRRDFLAGTGGWDETFGCASDTELMWRVMEQRRPIAHRGTVGALYRMRPGSVSDVYRSRGWLTWEGAVANLVSLSRVRAKRPLSRAQRMHYVRLWQRWQAGSEGRKVLPEGLRARLEARMGEVAPPPKVDVLMTRLRDGVAAR
jgi:glycosyltransferase involved in cell wall biosynthesis